MSEPRIIIEPQFSIERRGFKRRAFALPPQPGFLIVHFIESRIEEISTGSSLLVNPHQTLRLAPGRGSSEILLVRLAPELLIEIAARLRLYRMGANLLFRQPAPYLTVDERLRAVLEAMSAEIASGAAGWREVIGSLINQLAVYLLRAHINVRRSDEIELSRAGIVDRRLRRAIEFMHDNCGRELSLAEIAASAYLSAFHFARLFKKITGAPPHA